NCIILAERENCVGQNLAPSSVCAGNGFPCECLHSANDRNQHQSAVDEGIRWLVLCDVSNCDCCCSVEQVSPENQKGSSCEYGRLGFSLYNNSPSLECCEEVSREEKYCNNHSPDNDLVGCPLDVLIS